MRSNAAVFPVAGGISAGLLAKKPLGALPYCIRLKGRVILSRIV